MFKLKKNKVNCNKKVKFEKVIKISLYKEIL